MNRILLSQEVNSLLNSLVGPVMIYAPNGKVIKANPPAVRDLGFNPLAADQQTVIVKLNAHLLGDKKLNRKNLPSAIALQGRSVSGRQLVFRDAKGRRKVVLCSASPMRIRGKIVCAVITWIDITERTLAEQTLKDSNLLIKEEVRKRTRDFKQANFALSAEIKKRAVAQAVLEDSYAFLEKIFSTTTFLIAYMDDDCKIIRVNEAFARPSGKKPEQFVGKNLFQLFPSAEHEAYVREVISSGEPFTFYQKAYEFAHQPERGVTYWDCSLVPVKDPAGEVKGVIMCLVDRTAGRRGQDELVRKEKELNDGKRLSEIGRLAAIVAHELRNPLGAIRSAAFNVRMKAGTPRIENNLNNIEAKVMESEQIISNLLSYSRVKIPRFEAVRIAALLNECIDGVCERFRKRKMFLGREFLSIKDTLIWADPVQLREVFLNILNNAYDACPAEEGLIEVKGRPENPDSIAISFRDNGTGISPEQAKRIFEPFFTTKAKGTGLGLSICKQMVELHGGQISVDGKLGEGTTVKLILPIGTNQILKNADPHK